MLRPLRYAFLVLLALGTLLISPSVQAALPYQGLYVVIDPYFAGDIQSLQSASQTACVSGQNSTATPFCGAVNGLMIRIPWCDFQLYHISNAQGNPIPSCHYVVGFSNGLGSAGVQIPALDQVSPCAGQYDICTGQPRSVLATTLRYITLVNNQRAKVGLPPLQISLGMYAGDATPEAVLDAVGYVDVPHSNSPTNAAQTQCLRLPMSWKSQFLTAYEQAANQLLSFVQAQFPAGSNIRIWKLGGINSVDQEIEQPGRNSTGVVPSDPGPTTVGPLLGCSSNQVAAATWLNAYNQNPVNGKNFSGANEAAFGNLIGSAWAMLANAGLPNTLISIPTTNGDAFASIDCGVNGSTACSVKGASAGNYSLYYLDRYIDDLFSGGPSYQAAQSAYNANRADTFSLSPSQVSVNSTALSPTPLISLQQVPCNLNNTNPGYAPTTSLDGSPVTVLGSGTIIAYQTATLQGGLCSSTQYMTALNNGISNGAMFLEVEDDAAFTDIAQCSPYLANALSQLLYVSAPTSCSY